MTDDGFYPHEARPGLGLVPFLGMVALVLATMALGAYGTVTLLKHRPAEPPAIVDGRSGATPGVDPSAGPPADGTAPVAGPPERAATGDAADTPPSGGGRGRAAATQPGLRADDLPTMVLLEPSDEIVHLPALRAGRTAPAAGDERVRFLARPGGDVVLPVKTRNVRPVYPPVARTARIGGVVVLEAVITAEGRVEGVQVARSVPMLDAAAVAAIRKWRYTPGRLNRVPIDVPVIIDVEFQLR